MSAIRRRHATPGASVDAKEPEDAPAPVAAPPPQGDALTNQRVASFFLAIIAAAIYANTLTADMCYDDNFAVVNNKDVTGVNPISALWSHDFWGQNITKVRRALSCYSLLLRCSQCRRLIYTDRFSQELSSAHSADVSLESLLLWPGAYVLPRGQYCAALSSDCARIQSLPLHLW